MARSIGSINLDDPPNSYIHEITKPSARNIQLEQILNRWGRVTRVKEDWNPLKISIRGTWGDTPANNKFYRDFKAGLLMQSRVPLVLGDGTRYEWVDVEDVAETPLAQSAQDTATPTSLWAYTIGVACYEPFAREVAPTLQALGALNGPNALTANQSSIETSTTGWVVGTNCTIAQTGTQFLVGTHSLQQTASSAATMTATTTVGTGGIPVTGLTTYTALASVRAAVTARSCSVGIAWYTSTGTLISTSAGTPVTSSASAWTPMNCTVTSPATAAFAAEVLTTTSPANAEVGYWDAMSLAAGTSSTWQLGGGATGSITLNVNCVGTAFSEPTWQMTLNIPTGSTVSSVSLANSVTGETITVTPAAAWTAGTWVILFDASGGYIPPAGTAPTPGNNGYALLATPSVGYGVTAWNGTTSVDQAFLGRVPTLVPNPVPSVPPVAYANAITATITGLSVTSASLSVLAPSRWIR